MRRRRPGVEGCRPIFAWFTDFLFFS
jgi:hypothetical protein